MRAGRMFGPLVLTTVKQGSAAPIVDGCGGEVADGRRYGGYAILRSQWRTTRRERHSGEALVIGWIGASVPLSPSRTTLKRKLRGA